MRIEPPALLELQRICAESFDRELSDSEAQAVAERILSFLKNSEPALDLPNRLIDTKKSVR
jgi:hypothetical protein